MSKTLGKLFLLTSIGLLTLVLPVHGQEGQDPQPQDDETRQIKLSDFTKKRPPADTKSAKPKPTTASGGDSASWNEPTYHRVKPKARVKPNATAGTSTAKASDPKPKTPKPAATEVREVGVTVWRLRPATPADNGPAFSVLKDGKAVVLTPERIEGTSPVSLGDRVRMSIESPRTGYLYVINREQYADGTMGKPVLIFPTTRVRGGDNAVVAGRLVDIPDASDAQPFFTLTTKQQPGQPAIVGELLTVVITEKPLAGIVPSRSPLPLSPDQVAKWENDWEGDIVELLEMNNGVGRTWTEQEKLASEMTRSLTQEDPTPQTIYRVVGQPNEPVMLTVQLIYGQSIPKQTTSASSQ
jgi:Domain of unknown function (DUF4384)